MTKKHKKKNRPEHAKTPAAKLARKALKHHRENGRRAAEQVLNGAPLADPRQPWTEMPTSALRGGAKSFAVSATLAGHAVAARSAGGAVQVGVHREDGGGLIRATWLHGVSLGTTFEGVARPVTVAKYRLTMPLAEADARFAAEVAARVAKANATKAAHAV